MSELNAQELSLIRSIKKTAIVILLLYRLDRPVGESEISDKLDIDRKTARKYLRSLAQLGIVTRTQHFEGYTLTQGGRQLLLSTEIPELSTGDPPLGKISPSEPITIINLNSRDLNLKNNNNKALGKNSPMMGKISPSTPLAEALQREGIIHNDRTDALFCSDFLSPEHVIGHAARLKKIKQERYETGLLISVLETLPEDDVPPRVCMETGHLADCHCEKCATIGYKSWVE